MSQTEREAFEQDIASLTGDAVKDVDPYKWFMMNEPHLNLTPIEVDPETGFRFTTRAVGMTRGMRDDLKSVMKVFLDPLPHVILDQDIPIRGWYKSKFEPPSVRPRPCYTEALLTQPYGGFCAVGCGFCYINHGLRGYRGQGLATVDPNYGEKVRKQISKMRLGTAVYMSSFIDPFLELEDHYHNTQNTARAALDAGLPIFFLTRKRVPGWAYDYLQENPHNYMQFSINTSNPRDWSRLSPRAIPLDEMIAQVREMNRRGIYVSIQVNPIVAGVIENEDIVQLIHTLSEAGANHLIFKFVEISFPSVAGMIRQMKMRFGDERGEKFAQLFTCNIGSQRTIDEAYRKKALDLFSVECKKAGVTMALCYEYEFARDKEGKILSATGVSMGAKYLTADQCHGHRVPMYSREDLKEPFKAMDVCPPSGCLTCADSSPEGKTPCGDELLSQAIALEPKHYKAFREAKGIQLRVIK